MVDGSWETYAKYWYAYSFLIRHNFLFSGLLNYPTFYGDKEKVFSTPKEVWFSNDKMLKRAGLTPKLISVFKEIKANFDIDKQWKNFLKTGINLITIHDSNYPQKLLNIAKPPPVIFTKGTLDFSAKIVGIVGARKASQSALNFAKKAADAMAKAGIVVVSGFARGIDTISHIGALSGGGKTIAVLGNGIDICYPSQNKSLTEKVVNNGLILSEFPPGTPPYPSNFPKRNRIISGLSDGVLIIQASQRSGTLITAKFALEQGKDIYVVPGAFDDPTWKGGNDLLKDGACHIGCLKDLAQCLDFSLKSQSINLSEVENEVYELIKLTKPSVDDICAVTKKDIAELSRILLTLELSGLVTKDLFNRYFAN